MCYSELQDTQPSVGPAEAVHRPVNQPVTQPTSLASSSSAAAAAEMPAGTKSQQIQQRAADLQKQLQVNQSLISLSICRNFQSGLSNE